MLTIVLVAAIVTVALIAINSVVTPQQAWRRWAMCLLMFLVLGIDSYLWVDLTGRPKPHGLELRTGKTLVLAEHWLEGQAVWIWVVWPDDPVPKAYAMPWSEEIAERLRDSRQGEAEDGDMPVAEFGQRRRDADGKAEVPAAGARITAQGERPAPPLADHHLPRRASP